MIDDAGKVLFFDAKVMILGENEVISEEMMGMLNGLDEKEANRVEDVRFREKSDAKLMKNKGFSAKSHTKLIKNKGFCTNSRDSEASFWRRVKKSEGCWLWNGVRGLDGICGLHFDVVDGKKVIMTAHRYMWILKHGEIPDDVVVRQSCGNGLCVNPEHLEVRS